MEKLKRLQEGADLDELLAEMDEELPSDDEEDEYDEETAHMTAVQKRVSLAVILDPVICDHWSRSFFRWLPIVQLFNYLQTMNADKLFSEDVKKNKRDEATRRELQALRKRLNCGGTNNAIDAFDDLLNASSNKVQKTKVDVRSENAKKFRDMFDKGKEIDFSDRDQDHNFDHF